MHFTWKLAPTRPPSLSLSVAVVASPQSSSIFESLSRTGSHFDAGAGGSLNPSSHKPITVLPLMKLLPIARTIPLDRPWWKFHQINAFHVKPLAEVALRVNDHVSTSHTKDTVQVMVKGMLHRLACFSQVHTFSSNSQQIISPQLTSPQTQYRSSSGSIISWRPSVSILICGRTVALASGVAAAATLGVDVDF